MILIAKIHSIEEADLKVTKQDVDKEIECEHCSQKVVAKDYDDHLNDCETYKSKIKADIEKNKFAEVQP